MTRLDAAGFARILAHIQHFPADSHDEVLRRLGSTPDELSAASSEVPLALSSAAEAGDVRPAQAFSGELSATKARLEKDQPKLEAIQPLEGRQPLVDAKPIEQDPDATHPAASSAPRRAALPFDPTKPAAPPAPIPVVRREPSPDDTALDVRVDLSRPALPFAGVAHDPFSAWTLERYASFTADRQVDGLEVARARYGIATEADEHALYAYMNQKLAGSPQVYGRWRSLVEARLDARRRKL